MQLFLTSSPCDDNVPEGVTLPCILDASNGLVARLQERFSSGTSCVIIAASPDAFALNDQMAWTFEQAFAYHGMAFSRMRLIDSRNEDELPDALRESGVVILAGGHVPTENAFFVRLGLRELMQNYEGIVMGISAGTMNCCDEVYAQPEEPGEAADPAYRRFIRGLGLTDVMVLPHYQKVKDYWLDGQRLYDDITYGDSYGRVFYALVDGSYVLVENGHAMIYGEAYEIRDGQMTQLTAVGESYQIK